MNSPLGFLAGTSLLDSNFLGNFKEASVSTEQGDVTVYRSPELVAIQRHAGPDGYRPPHRIRHKAHFQAFQEFGVERVLSLQSAGSLKESIATGSFLVPDDFIQPWKVVSAYDDERGHVVPSFDEPLRRQIIGALDQLDLTLRPTGTYVETQGPRFETPAEARMFQDYGDCVGMTAASELIIATQMDIDYATLCSIDNYVNGIAGTEITLGSFQEAVKQHEPDVRRVALHLLEHIAGLETESIQS